MVRTLIIIIVSGLVLSVACFSGAFAIGGRELIQSGEVFRSWFHDWDDDDWDTNPSRGPAGPTVSREIAWDESDRLEIALPADVVFTQAPTARLTVTGPQDAVNRVVLDGGRLHFRDGRRGWFRSGRGGWNMARIQVTAAAPDTKAFSLFGSPDLTITGFDQDELELEIHGSGDVVANGRAGKLSIDVGGSGVVDSSGLVAREASVDMKGSGKVRIAPQTRAEVSIAGSGDVVGVGTADKVEIEIKGSGDADLSQVAAKDAEVEIMGSGKAKIAPTGVADIAIFGSGDVTLAARPASLRSKTAGSGRIEQLETQTATAPATTASAAGAAK
jgi:hypothetical protein